MKTKTNRWLILLWALFTLVALACNVAQPTPTLTTAPPPQTEASSPTDIPPTPTVAATDTPPATEAVPVTSGGCTFGAAFVSDVTVPDGTAFAPGESFVKTWRVRNTGTCDWEEGTKLVFISAEQMGGPSSVAVPPVAVGSQTDINVNLVAPSTSGDHEGNWQLQAPDGTRFGPVLFVKITVNAPGATIILPTSTPLAGGIILPTPTSTPLAGIILPTLPVPCIAADPVLQPIWEHAQAQGYDIGCPTEPAQSVQGAFQEFWANVEDTNPHTHYRSLMIWRADNRDIYVLDGNDTDCSTAGLLAYTDTWEDGQPSVYPDCQGMNVPNGYQLPIRGFGKVWCYNHLEDAVGWPSEGEVAVTLLVQPTQTGLLLYVPAPNTGYLIALDYRAVEAVTMMKTP